MTGLLKLYVADSEWLHVLSTTCDHCRTCHYFTFTLQHIRV